MSEHGVDVLVEDCTFENVLFTRIRDVKFRRAESDGTPVMAMRLGESEAFVPLPALQRELGIADDSPDGRMFALVIEALDYVDGLNIGDKLPREVIDGAASWDLDPRFRARANDRLRIGLLTWIGAAVPTDIIMDRAAIGRLDEDPRVRSHLSRAIARAASALGLQRPDELLRLMEELAEELAYIEALRERLLEPVQRVVRRLEILDDGFRGDIAKTETLSRVRHIAAAGLAQIRERFEEVDEETGETLDALRNADALRSFIRSGRDWLYRCQRIWRPVIRDLSGQSGPPDETTWAALGRAYHVLAPHYMPVTEWRADEGRRTPRKTKKLGNAMQW